MALALGAAPATAQRLGPPDVPLGGSTAPAFEEVPAFAPAGAAPVVGTPPRPRAARPEGGAESPRVFIRGVRVTGNTALDAAELAAVTDGYRDRYVTREDLEALRLALTQRYVERGYVNSGAVIPDQRVTDGVVELRIVEGRLTRIDVAGNRQLDADYVAARLALGAGPPLNTRELTERLQILLENPIVERVNAQIEPGDRPGEARLRAVVDEAPPYHASLGADTDLSPSLGDARAVLRGALYSPLGRGDVLSAEAALASGLTDVYLNYSIPLTARDLALDVYYQQTDSTVVRKPLRDLDLEGDSSTFALRLSQPVYRTGRDRLTLAAGLDLRESQTSLLGRGFPLAEGVEPDGTSRITALRFIQDWLSRTETDVLAARSTFSVGIQAFGATVNPGDVPDGQFVAWLGQLQWARRLDEADNQLVFRLQAQLASEALLPLEQFPVGGLWSVRGYPTNTLVRDQGFATSLELRVPVLRREDGAPLLQVVPFVDAGGAWFKDRGGTPAPQTIASAGLGLRFDPIRRVHGEVYWGYAFQGDELPDSGSSLQDAGWGFVLTAELP